MVANRISKRILYVTMDSLEQNSSANIRNIGLIKGLLEIGYSVDTFSVEKDSTSIRYDEDCKIDAIVSERYYFKASRIYSKFRTKKTPGGVEQLGEDDFKRKGNLLKTIIKKILPSISPYDIQRVNVCNVKNNICHLSKYEYVISSSDPKSAHLIVRRLLKGAKSKPLWIQYWGDPFFSDVTQKSGKISGFRRYKAEKKLLSKADKVVYTTKLTLEAQKDRYKKYASKMSYAVQATVPYQDWIPVRDDGKITVGYFGNYSSKYRNLEPLVNAVANTDIELILCGEGDGINITGDNVRLIGRCGYNEAVSMESKVNIIVCVCNKGGTQIPGKIFYSAGHDKPVVVVVDGENKEQLKTIFSEYGRFIICDNSKEEIKKALDNAKDALKYLEEDKGRHYPIPENLTETFLARTVLG